MNVQKKLPTSLIVFIYLASVAVLVLSPAAAADTAPSATIGQGTTSHGPGHHGAFNATMQAEHLQSVITKLGQQGIDISQVQADLTAGNLDAVRTWLRDYSRDHPMTFANRTGMRSMMNPTMQAEHLQSVITKLGLQGIDISQVQASLNAGNLDAVRAWLQTYRKEHPGGTMNLTAAHRGWWP